jgi:hypothetical protein
VPTADGRVPDKNGLVPPQLIGADEKKLYPPTQWRPLRVMNPWHKFAFLVGQWLVVRGVAYVLGLILPTYVGGPLMGLLTIVVAVTLVRSFRGADEPVAPPRAWWRLTARPLAGWWLAAYFLLPVSAWLVLLAGHRFPMTASGLVETVLSCLLAAAFLNSSIRLVRRAH